MAKKIGLFGGSFDPPHLGHLHLAMVAKETKGLDEVWWLPAARSPHKELEPASAEHRVKMLELICQKYPWMKVVDIELRRPAPSFTIDTLRALRVGEDDNEYFWLMSADLLPSFERWKEPEEILRRVQPLVLRRNSKSWDFSCLPKWAREKFEQGKIEAKVVEISSTELREALAEKKPCEELLMKEVFRYTIDHCLYVGKAL